MKRIVKVHEKNYYGFNGEMVTKVFSTGIEYCKLGLLPNAKLSGRYTGKPISTVKKKPIRHVVRHEGVNYDLDDQMGHYNLDI